ncbi:MAG: hypothetical protein JKY94_04235 [Rhodobacteraceae bacterium]|nr:hypothetical protein [Paracoccaceae bacterium]
MKRFIWMIVVLLGACDSPSAHFRDSPATRVSVGKSVFDVRVRGNIAESIRVNVQYAPRLGRMAGLATRAMRQVSGCEVEHVLGDASVQLGLLNCGPNAPDWAAILRQGTGRYDCFEVGAWTSGSSGTYYSDFECDPY